MKAGERELQIYDRKNNKAAREKERAGEMSTALVRDFEHGLQELGIKLRICRRPVILPWPGRKYIQGDASGCSPGFVDIKAKVVF